MKISIPNGSLLGICDSKGTEFYVGCVVRRLDNVNDTHGSWVDYTVSLRGTTPIISYLISEKGHVLPVGFTATCLCNEYDHKMFLFATDLLSLTPDSELVIQ